MGFFNKIFGGKKSKSKEIETKESQEIKNDPASTQQSSSSQTLPDEEAKVEISGEIPIVSSEIIKNQPKEKSTVFGMPAPLIPVSTEEEQKEEEQKEEEQKKEEQKEEEQNVSNTTEHSQNTMSGTIETGTIEINSSDSTENDLTEKIETEIPEESQETASEQNSEQSSKESKNIEQINQKTTETDDYIPETITLDHNRSSAAFVICSSCGKQLPVPYIGYPAKITCPFCLTINNYNQN